MKKTMLVTGMVCGILFMLVYVFIQSQEQTVTLRYSINVDDIWRYDCIEESESNSFSAPTHKETGLGNIKEDFKYEVLEVSPEGHFKVKLNTTPIESKGVDINWTLGTRDESHNLGSAEEYDEILLNLRGEVLTMTLKGVVGGEGTIMSRERHAITGTLWGVSSEMIRYLHPVMPEGAVGNA